jgi:hypothetical protein
MLSAGWRAYAAGKNRNGDYLLTEIYRAMHSARDCGHNIQHIGCPSCEGASA